MSTASAKTEMPAFSPTEMGARNHRAWVGVPDYYDRLGAVQFLVLLQLGLREEDTLLDIGCGSLRGGRFSLLYLKPSRYYGLEPEQWCLDCGIENEVGRDLIRIKQPRFSANTYFDGSEFGVSFGYVIAAGIFMHTSLEQIRDCFLNTYAVLRDDGIVVGAFIKGDEGANRNHWTYPEIQTYREQSMREQAHGAGFDLHVLDAPHPLNHTWFALTKSRGRAKIGPCVDMAAFTWERYLATQIEQRGAAAETHEGYLRRELSTLIADDDYSIVPQVRL